MISQRIKDLAARFWEEAGEEEPFPRRLEDVIQGTKPLSIHSLARLCPQGVQDWLRQRGHAVEFATPHRWLDGCLYSNKGTGFLFVEESLTPEYRRVVVAHELGHFLADYEAPRRRVESRLGASLFPILDAERTPTASEQLSACLAGVSAEPFVHFMDRESDGTYVEPVSQVEQTADELGLELLAPWRAVVALVQAGRRWPGEAADWEHVLQTRFGLPGAWATHYAERLLGVARGRLKFSEALGL